MEKTQLSQTSRNAKLGDNLVPYEVRYVDESDFDFPEPVGPDYVVIRYEDKIAKIYTYVPIYGGFDIETTNVLEYHYEKGKKVYDKKHAYAYHMQFSIFSRERGVVYLMRTWEDVGRLIHALKEFYGLGEFTRMVLWDANLGFEMQFLRKRFHLERGKFDFFAKERRQPLLITIGGIEFRECLSISGGSLAQLCKDYTYTQKLKGDLDYSKPRNSHTPMTEEEINYCINDVVPLAEWSYYIFQNYVVGGGTIPLTKTGILRHEVKMAAKALLKGRSSEWKTLLKAAYPDKETYQLWNHLLFRGGYVHANIGYVGREIKDLSMYDITSSYPASMNLSLFPTCFLPVDIDLWSEELLDKMAKDPKKSFIAKVHFNGLEQTTLHSIESRSKVVSGEGFKLDNGRIKSAKEMSVWMTDYDWLIYRMFYKWDSIDIESLEWSKNMKLPPYLLNVLNEHYKEKARLKAAGLNDTPIYSIHKSTVNATFGLTVTRIELNSWHYVEDWIEEEDAREFEEEANRAVLLPQWGIWIAARSRYNLLRVAHEIEEKVGKDYEYGACCYFDTDSIKCVDDPRIKDIIDSYNAEIAELLKKNGLTDPAFHDLGMYDYEGHATRMKFLGAKRYLTEMYDKEGKLTLKATVAGLPKVTLKNNPDAFEMFKPDGMVIPDDKSNKTTHAWVDWETSDIVDGEEMHEYSSVAIYDIPFSLKLDDDYYMMVGEYLMKEDKKL